MAVQTVVIDVFQTNKKLKEFDKNVDRLGKSFEKMRKQMERFNQDKRSTGLSLSQGDMFSKSVDKMTNTMTKLFSNGIKINNPTVNAKVTVDFAKMNLAGQMGSALKNADIAGTILRNLRLPKMGISNASAFKVDIPNKMQVEITNKELQVKLPKEPSQGKKQGFLTRSREKFDEARGKYVDKQYRKSTTNSFQKSTMENIEKSTTEGISKGLPEVFNKAKNGVSKAFAGLKGLFSGKKEKIPQDSASTGKNLRPKKTYRVSKSWEKRHIKGSFERGIEETTGNFVKNLNFIGRVIPDSFNSLKSLPRIFGGMKTAFSGLSLGGKVGGIATAGISIFSIALKGLTGAIKGAAGIIKGVIGIFQNIASVVSSIWGQVQKWAINPLVDAQNQMSQNKGYWNMMGGEIGARTAENRVYDLAKKGPFDVDVVDSAFRKLKNTGMEVNDALDVIWKTSNIAAAKSMDEEGFMQGIETYLQASTNQYATVEDFNSMANFSDTKTMTKHLLGIEEATEEDIKRAKELLSGGQVEMEKLIEAYEKTGQEYIGFSKKFGGDHESMAEEVASTTYQGVVTKMKNIFKIDIVKKWGTGLSEGLAEGFSGFASWLDDNKTTFAAWGEQLKIIGKHIGEYITGFLQNTGERIKGVFNSSEFQQADLSDKIVIFWDKVIKDPFSEWWNSTGKSFFEKTFKNLGETTGGILSGLINGFLGSNPEDGVGEGYNLGFKFAAGFMKGFDMEGIIGKILGALAKISWNYSFGIVLNPVFRWIGGLFKGGEKEEEKVLENSQYKDNVQFYEKYEDTSDRTQYKNAGGIRYLMYQENEETKKAREENNRKAEIRIQSVKWAQEAEYDRADIKGYKDKNELTDVLYKQANDATWEYNYNEKLRDEALANGDETAVGIAEMKMLQAQNDLNAATGELHRLYPGIIDAEGMVLDVMQKRLEKQKEINEEIRRGKIIQMKNDLAQKEKQLDSYKSMAKYDEKAMEEARVKFDEFNDNAENIVDDFLNWSELDVKGDKGADTAKQGLTDRMTAMGFTEDEIKQVFKDEKENGYTGEAIATLVRERGDTLNGDLVDATERYNASMAFLREIVTAKDGVIADDIEKLAGMSLEELKIKDNWNKLEEPIREQILEKIKEMEELKELTDEFGIEPIHKQIFFEIQVLGGVATEGGENGQPTGQGATTVKTGAEGVQETANQLLTALGVKKEATGDILTSPHMALVAEAGPEAIIPLSKGRRARGLELWEKAGQMMGVYPHADGGMFGSFTVPRQTPHLYQQIKESREESESAGGQISQIDMGGVYLGGVNFTFNGTEANSREGIMKVIKEQMPDIADEIAGTIAVNIQRIFANMKLQTS